MPSRRLSRRRLPLLAGAALAALLLASDPAFAVGLDQARAQGMVCEGRDGLIHKAAGGPGVDGLIADVNAKRMATYRDIAAKDNVPLAQVQAFYGQTLQGKHGGCR
ncbi:DUF1318 domain-containing protein [Roseospirillum parvum]|uniref:DUF1318 domain-containing protein n=1 Tax=Roseospirillum parvum TaxID=83401 RepID=A0A1G7XKK2_9PROT|nr:DUF1318 domain-containing protein [Roseospirillum parvum]SDG84596.1 hypothetical protein SAMN05421742_10313 [Roseospirillum parvum]